MKTKLLFSIMFALVSHIFNSQSLDPTFGNNGVLNFDYECDFYEHTISSDGKIFLPGTFNNADKKAVLVKINSDGSLDTTFGINGKFEINNYHAANNTEDFDNVRILPDGKIVMNYFYNDSGNGGTHILRLNANGTLDNTFNNPISSNETAINYFEILPTGKILGIGNNSLIRVSTDGSLDLSYANNGIRLLPFLPYQIFINSTGVFLHDYQGTKMVKMTDEVAEISASYNFTYNTHNIIKMNNGYFYIPNGGFSLPNSRITKIDYNLVPDSTFGTNGIYIQDNNYILQAIQENGSLLFGFTSSIPGTLSTNILLQRINANGFVDQTFGNQGTFTYPLTSPFDLDFVYHPILKKMYIWTVNTANQTNALVSRFNIPNEILAVQNASKLSKVTIVENPVKDILKFSESIKNVQIYTSSGIETGVSFTGDQFSVNQLASGVYFVSGVDHSGKFINLKFIKK